MDKIPESCIPVDAQTLFETTIDEAVETLRR